MKQSNKAQLAIALSADISEMFTRPELTTARREPHKKLLCMSYDDVVQYGLRLFMLGRAWME